MRRDIPEAPTEQAPLHHALSASSVEQSAPEDEVTDERLGCGVCGSKHLERVAYIAVIGQDSYYGPKCLDCGAYMDTESGSTEWEIGRRSERKN